MMGMDRGLTMMKGNESGPGAPNSSQPAASPLCQELTLVRATSRGRQC